MHLPAWTAWLGAAAVGLAHVPYLVLGISTWDKAALKRVNLRTRLFAGALMLGGYVYLMAGWFLFMKQPHAAPAFANDWQEAVFVGMAAFWLLRFAGNLRAKPTRYQLLGDGALALLWVFDALFPFAMRLSKGMDFFQAFAVLAVAELALVAFVFLMYREKQQPAA